MKLIDSAVSKAKDVVTDVTTHWKKPAQGNYIPYKEMLSYAVGGMGQNMVVYILSFFALGAGNTLLGATLGIRPMHLQLLAMLQSFMNIFMAIIRSKIVDNTRTKYGRFRPYIAIMGFPLTILAVIFLWLDFKSLSYNQILLAVAVFALTLSMVQPLFTDTYSELGTTITPNSKERTLNLTVGSIIFSFAPTVYTIAVPFIMSMTNLTFMDINTYRYIIATVSIFGVGLNLFAAIGCKERVIASKAYIQKIGVFKGCLEIYRNKYWWLRTIASLVGFLEGANLVIFGWIYMYGTQNMAAFGVMTGIIGSASGIAMFISPYLIEKLGNRSLLLTHNTLNIFFNTLMLLSFKIPILFFIFLYINTIVNQLGVVYNPTQHSEVKDYQYYLSGKRMDFTFVAAGQILFPITLLTGLVIPFIYESCGITTNYDSLFNPIIRNRIFSIVCMLSILGALLNLLPYFFYDLSRAKHKNYIRVLYYRKMFADYVDGNITDEAVINGIDALNQVDELDAIPMPDVKAIKADLKAVKHMDKSTPEAIKLRKQTRFQLLKDLYHANRLVEEKKSCSIVKAELNKFENPIEFFKVEKARYLVEEITLSGINSINQQVLIDAEKMPRNNAVEIANRKYAISFAKKLIKMKEMAEKYYPNGIIEPAPKRIEDAISMPDIIKDNTKEENKANVKMKNIAIKEAEKEINFFSKTAQVFVDSRTKIKEYDSRIHFENIKALYDNAMINVAELREKYFEEEKVEKEKKKTELEKIRKEKFDKLPKEKQDKVLAKRKIKEDKKKAKAELKKQQAEKEKLEKENLNQDNSSLNNDNQDSSYNNDNQDNNYDSDNQDSDTDNNSNNENESNENNYDSENDK